MRIPFSFLLVVAALATVRTAAAEAPRATSVSWVRLPGAERCIDVRALALQVERRLGRPMIATPARADRAVEGRIEPAPGGSGFRATFTLSDELGAVLGTREIASAAADCRSMDDDLGLVVALMIDAEATFAAPPPSSELIPRPAGPIAAPAQRGVPAPAATVAAPPAPSWSAALRAGAVFSVGLLPSVGAGFAVRATVTPPWLFPVEVGGTLWAPQRVTSTAGDFGAEIWMAYGSVAACPLAGERRGFFLAACLGLEVGAAHVGGFGFEVDRARDVALANVALAGHARRAIVGPIFGALSLGVAVPFVRLDVVYESGGQRREAFSAPPLAGTMELAIGLEFR